MIVKGLNKDLYLVGNPIWVEVEEIQSQVKYIEISLTDVTNPTLPINSRPVRIYFAGNSTRYNIQEAIKGNFPAPRFTVNEGDIKTNYVRFTITIKEVIVYLPTDSDGRGRDDRESEYTQIGDLQSFTKTFIRGWEKSMLTNITLSIGDELKDSELIPRWGGYPVMRFYIGGDKKIYGSQFIPSGLIEEQKVIGCDPLYLRYLNSKGGYSYWMFESYEEKTDNKSLAYTERFEKFEHTGVTTEITLEAETRVTAPYFKAIQALLRSPEIHVYNKYGVEWARVILKDSSPIQNNYETAMKVNISLEVLTQETSSTIW